MIGSHEYTTVKEPITPLGISLTVLTVLIPRSAIGQIFKNKKNAVFSLAAEASQRGHFFRFQ